MKEKNNSDFEIDFESKEWVYTQTSHDFNFGLNVFKNKMVCVDYSKKGEPVFSPVDNIPYELGVLKTSDSDFFKETFSFLGGDELIDEDEISLLSTRILHGLDDLVLFVLEHHKKHGIDPNVLKRHILWAWSRDVEDIIIEQEAQTHINHESVRFIKLFRNSQLPIVHAGYHIVLARLSIAFACLYHSVDEAHEKVIVKKTHVEQAVDFCEHMFDRLDLGKFVLDKKKKTQILDEEKTTLIAKLNTSHCYPILKVLVSVTETISVLAIKFAVSNATIRRRLDILREMELVESIRGKGNKITDKGVKALKLYEEIFGEDSTPEDKPKEQTTLFNNEEKLHDILTTLRMENIDNNSVILKKDVLEMAKKQGMDEIFINASLTRRKKEGLISFPLEPSDEQIILNV